MIKKRVICIIASLAIMINFSLVTSAQESSYTSLFVSESKANELQYNMYEDDKGDYYYLYGTDNIIFDFNHAMPNYVLDYSKAADAIHASDMLKFTDCYIVPTINTDNRFIAFTEFKQIPDIQYANAVLQQYSEPEYKEIYNELKSKYTNHEGEWEIVGTFQDGDTEDFYSFITSNDNDILTCQQSYLISDDNGYNILLASGDKEMYFSFNKYNTQSTAYSSDTNNGTFIDGNDLIDIAVEQYEAYNNLVPDSAGAADNNINLNFNDEILDEVNDEHQKINDSYDNDIEPDTINTSNPKTGSSVSYFGIITLISSLVCFSVCKKNNK